MGNTKEKEERAYVVIVTSMDRLSLSLELA